MDRGRKLSEAMRWQPNNAVRYAIPMGGWQGDCEDARTPHRSPSGSFSSVKTHGW